VNLFEKKKRSIFAQSEGFQDNLHFHRKLVFTEEISPTMNFAEGNLRPKTDLSVRVRVGENESDGEKWRP